MRHTRAIAAICAMSSIAGCFSDPPRPPAVSTFDSLRWRCEDRAAQVKHGTLADQDAQSEAQRMYAAAKADVDAAVTDLQSPLDNDSQSVTDAEVRKKIARAMPTLQAFNEWAENYIPPQIDPYGGKPSPAEAEVLSAWQKFAADENRENAKVLSHLLEGMRLRSWSDL